MKKKTTKRQRRIFTSVYEQTTFLAAGLGELGLTSEAIARECRLSEGQVNYRLKVLGIRRVAYRSGKSKLSWKIIRSYLAVAQDIARDKANRV